MKMCIPRIILITLLFMAPILPHAPGSEPLKKSDASRTQQVKGQPDSVQEKCKLSGEESPESLIVKYLMSVANGKPAITASCFDESTKAGKAQSSAMQCLSKAIAAYQKARRLANQKFGAEGVAVIDSEFKPGFLPEYKDPAKMQKMIDKKIEVVREDPNHAFARTFGDNTYLHRKDDRWYITPYDEEKDLAIFCLSAAFSCKVWIDSFAKVPNFIKKSKSPEELREKIRKAVHDAEVDVKQQLDKTFDKTTKKERRSIKPHM